jgi:hypothetical protein
MGGPGSELEAESHNTVQKHHRRRRTWWKRRRLWVIILAVLVGFALTIWLIASITNYRESD